MPPGVKDMSLAVSGEDPCGPMSHPSRSATARKQQSPEFTTPDDPARTRRRAYQIAEISVGKTGTGMSTPDDTVHKGILTRCVSFCTYLNHTELSTCKFKTIARQTYICYLPACFSACVKDQPCNIHHPVVNILFCATCLFFINQGRHSMTAEAPYNSARIWAIDKLISGNRAIII